MFPNSTDLFTRYLHCPAARSSSAVVANEPLLRISMKLSLPWYVRIGAKIVLSRLPVPYSVWRRLSLFRHGRMDDADYAWNSFRRHYDRAVAFGLKNPFCGMEIGPGDSLASALIARAHGAERTYLVDAGDFASTDVEVYAQVSRSLAAKGKGTDADASYASRTQYLTANSATYLTGGLASLAEIGDGTVDFVWSEAVLEHIRLQDFDEFTARTRQVMRGGGIASHRVDLQDHLGGSLNNLRFRESLWESRFMSKSGFYTNRIRFSDMLSRLRHAGFEMLQLSVDSWEAPPLSRSALSAPYRNLTDKELAVSGFDIVLRAS